jgi:hypothetical protein
MHWNFLNIYNFLIFKNSKWCDYYKIYLWESISH